MLVLDVTAVLEILLARPAAERVMDAMIELAPVYMTHGVDLAVIDILRHYRGRGELSAERARRAVEDLARLPARKYALTDLEDLPLCTWQFSRHLVADAAASVALAEALGATLITCDPALGSAEPGAEILFVG